MKLHCTFSGVLWNAEGFASVGKHQHWQLPHPIFNLPLGSLLSRVGDFYSGKLNQEEQRLLFLATLNASRLIQWRTIATPSHSTIVTYFDQLAKIVAWIDMYEWNESLGRRRGPSFPQFVVTHDTKDLQNIKYWLEAWVLARGEYEAGQAKEETKEKQLRREQAIYRLINNSQRDILSYSKLVANWAADAAEFPANIFVKPFEDQPQMTLRDYWIQVLTDPKIYAIRRQDLEEIEEHLIENLDMGSIYAATALKLVREKLTRGKSSLGLDDLFSPEDVDAILSSPFEIVKSGDVASNEPRTHVIRPKNVEQQNLESVAAMAPEQKPERKNYPDSVSFLRATARWTIAQSQKQVN